MPVVRQVHAVTDDELTTLFNQLSRRGVQAIANWQISRIGSMEYIKRHSPETVWERPVTGGAWVELEAVAGGGKSGGGGGRSSGTSSGGGGS